MGGRRRIDGCGGRRPSEEWPSVVSAVLRWRLSALIARPLPLNLNRAIFVSVWMRLRERGAYTENSIDNSMI